MSSTTKQTIAVEEWMLPQHDYRAWFNPITGCWEVVPF